MYRNVTCPECKKCLGDDYLICADKVADLFYWEGKEKKFIIPKETKLVLVENWKQNWKQTILQPWEKKSINANWKTGHRIFMSADGGCVVVYNDDNQRAQPMALCKLVRTTYKIEGPGAKEQEEQDRVKILELQLKKETELRKKAQAEATEERDNRLAEQIKTRFDGIGLEGVKIHRPFHSNHACGMRMDFETAEIVLYNLAGLDDEEFLKERLAKLEQKKAS